MMTAVIPDRQITEYLSEQKKQKQQRSSQEIKKEAVSVIKKVSKGRRWMPWLSEAMKDVISCDKLGVGANNL